MVNTVPGIVSRMAAVVAASVVVHRAMLPAPTSVTGDVTVTVKVRETAPPSLSVTVTRMASVPAERSGCGAAIQLAWLLVLPVVSGEPSPQSIAYDQGASFTPGSLKVTLKV